MRKLGKHESWLRAHVGWADEVGCLTWPYGKWSLKSGYGSASLWGTTMPAHTAMCTLVYGPRPSKSHHSAHSCGKGHLACVNPHHVYWATPTENARDKRRHGTTARLPGESNPWSKLSNADARLIRKQLGQGVPVKQLAKRFKVSVWTVQRIRSGKRYSCA